MQEPGTAQLFELECAGDGSIVPFGQGTTLYQMVIRHRSPVTTIVLVAIDDPQQLFVKGARPYNERFQSFIHSNYSNRKVTPRGASDGQVVAGLARFEESNVSASNPFYVTQQTDVTIVTLCRERYVDPADVDELESRLRDLVRDESPRKLLIDMHRVSMTTNAVHGVLLKVKKDIERNDGKMKLCNPSSFVIEALKVTRLLDNIFEVYDSTEEGIGSFTEEV